MSTNQYTDFRAHAQVLVSRSEATGTPTITLLRPEQYRTVECGGDHQMNNQQRARLMAAHLDQSYPDGMRFATDGAA